MTQKTRTIRVWDPVVRIGHWVLVIAFFTAYFTGEEVITQHVWAGYVVAAVLLLRVIWGFIGSRHARFSDFVRSPASAVRHLRELFAGRGSHYLGHNPAGGLMIVALLLSLAATTGSGLVLYAIEHQAGPLAGLVVGGTPDPMLLSPLPTAHAARLDDDDDDDEGDGEPAGEAFWEEFHEIASNLTLLLVALHIAGVVLSSRLEKQNLVRAMITGRKTVREDQADA